MNKRYLSRACLLALVSMLFLSGCATKPIAVPSGFWEQPQERVAIVLHAIPEEGHFMKEGSQGLLDLAINSAMMSEEDKHMRSLDADRFREVSGLFKEELEAAGFQPVVYGEEIDLADFPNVKNPKPDQFDRDLSELFAATGANKVIILRLTSYGAIRTYYGFIPTSDPKGAASVQGVMVDRDTGMLMWRTGTLEGVIREPVVGEWKESPDYPNLTAAVDRALAKSTVFLRDQFFNR